MTMREVDRLKVIEAVAECRLKPGQAADRLGLSVRQVERLVIRYREHGLAASLRAVVAGQATASSTTGSRYAP